MLYKIMWIIRGGSVCEVMTTAYGVEGHEKRRTERLCGVKWHVML